MWSKEGQEWGCLRKTADLPAVYQKSSPCAGALLHRQVPSLSRVDCIDMSAESFTLTDCVSMILEERLHLENGLLSKSVNLGASKEYLHMRRGCGRKQDRVGSSQRGLMTVLWQLLESSEHACCTSSSTSQAF